MTKATGAVGPERIETSWMVLTCDEGSVELAEQELHRVVPKALVVAHLAPGIMLVDTQRAFAAIVARWMEAPPIFVRHICPVQRVVPLWAGESDLDDMVAALGEQHGSGAMMAGLAPAEAFSVQSRLLVELPYKPFDINNALAAAITTATGATLDVRSPAQIISVVCVDLSAAGVGALPRVLRPDSHSDHQALLGLSHARDNLSNWAGGARRFAREEGQVSRSEFKLLEALEIFQIKLLARGVALDLGASPGGWTRVLRQRDQYVTAVDPGELDPRVASDPGVRHKRMTAEEYLRADPDEFDLIVNDMRMDGRDSARLMVACERRLYAHGFAIMTLKLPETGRNPILEHAFHILEDAYMIAGARQLFHNRSEITVYLKKKTGDWK